MGRLRIIFIIGLAIGLALSGIGCSQVRSSEGRRVAPKREEMSNKIGSTLAMHLDLRRDYLQRPTEEKLKRMEEMGLNMKNPEMQKVFLYFKEKPSFSTIRELEALGLRVDVNSWIPPVGKHPQGFLSANMPIDKVEKVAEKNYVLRLESAEVVFKPLELRPAPEIK